MIKEIKTWCNTHITPAKYLELPPTIIALLLDEKNNTLTQFTRAVKLQLDNTPKYLDIDFSPPVFPFDNRYFQDPFYLVEDCINEAIDLESIRKLGNNALDDYIKDIYDRFTYTVNGKTRIKKQELLRYAGRHYYFEAASKAKIVGVKENSNLKKQRRFITANLRNTVDIHITRTMQRAVLRKKVTNSNTAIEYSDIANFQRHAKERTNILVAIDTSKSMELGNKMEHAKKAAISFYYYKSSYSHESKIEFLSFNNTITKVKPLDIISLKPEGMTHTAELLSYAFSYFNRNTNKGRTELYMITDGYPQQAGMEDIIYHGLTLKVAGRLKALQTRIKIILIETPWAEDNTNNLKYNELICNMLGGELIRVEPEAISCALFE
ncbi:MAG: hypothetical protein L3V56_04070 [Candidatus Magnetoovum sp. WYHC-5]|nr:hypothetical protein [Candidatus Magnetoovum sp. WYHC-5]